MDEKQHLWAVVLATGSEPGGANGSCANELSAEVPMPFRTFPGRESMVRAAMIRAGRLARPNRIVSVVQQAHRPWWRPELAARPHDKIVVQPSFRGTAAAVLHALTEILRYDPAAMVAVLPATHHVDDEDILHHATERAIAAAREDPKRVVMLGVTPTEPYSDHEWLVPVSSTSGPGYGVARLLRHPGPLAAVKLLEQGAFWNSSTFAAGGGALLHIYEYALPGLMRAFDVYRRMGDSWKPWVLEALYEILPVWDLSRDVLEPAARFLEMVPVLPCGWTEAIAPAKAPRCVNRRRTFAGTVAMRTARC
jgi:mannose-1-phosphate guanylyltransferase